MLVPANLQEKVYGSTEWDVSLLFSVQNSHSQGLLSSGMYCYTKLLDRKKWK